MNIFAKTIPKSILVVFILLYGLFTSLFAQNPPENLLEFIKQNYSKHETLIPMRDGTRLFTVIYEPVDKSQSHPILLTRTPYSVSPYGENKFKQTLGPNELFTREGYIFVYQDVRGRWMSEGEFKDVRPINAKPNTRESDESTDTADTVEWLIKNVESNGRVGIWGISYPGFYTSAGIINSHPAIKAASPQAPISDWFRGDDIHHNGTIYFLSRASCSSEILDSHGLFQPIRAII